MSALSSSPIDVTQPMNSSQRDASQSIAIESYMHMNRGQKNDFNQSKDDSLPSFDNEYPQTSLSMEEKKRLIVAHDSTAFSHLTSLDEKFKQSAIATVEEKKDYFQQLLQQRKQIIQRFHQIHQDKIQSIEFRQQWIEQSEQLLQEAARNDKEYEEREKQITQKYQKIREDNLNKHNTQQAASHVTPAAK